LTLVSYHDTKALVIKSFKGEFAEAIHSGRRIPKGFPADVAKVARRKLVQLNNAALLGDLATPPGNRLEALKGRARRQALDSDQRPMAGRISLDREWSGRG
jgi:plasmid maintenance system killer protein